MEDVKRYGLVLLKSVTVIHEVKNGEYVEYNDYKELADKLEAVREYAKLQIKTNKAVEKPYAVESWENVIELIGGE